MDNTVITTIISVIGALAGAIIGSELTHYFDKQDKKIKLCFSIQPSDEGNETEPEYRTKTSYSDYCIVIYNIGQTPVVLERISLRHKKIITDCIIPNVITLMPYKSYTYQLTEQEYNAILFYCKHFQIKKCRVIAYDVGERSYRSELDLFLPHMQCDFR